MVDIHRFESTFKVGQEGLPEVFIRSPGRCTLILDIRDQVVPGRKVLSKKRPVRVVLVGPDGCTRKTEPPGPSTVHRRFPPGRNP